MAASTLTAIRKRLPTSWKRRLRPLYHMGLDAFDIVSGHRRSGLPPSRIMLPQIGRRDADFFYSGARWMADTVKTECGLRPDGSILDLGCGVGRLAIGLLDYLEPPGRYEGLDIDGASIRWARQRIEREHPDFRFQIADVYNSQYNPKGDVAPKDYRFPYDDDDFDVAFLHSVFTHMLPRDLERYLQELARVVRPGGVTHISYYLLNPESDAIAAGSRPAIDFPHDFGVYRSISRETPEYSVAYQESFLRDLYDKHGFTVEEPISYGNWTGREGARTYQDIVIARPTA